MLATAGDRKKSFVVLQYLMGRGHTLTVRLWLGYIEPGCSIKNINLLARMTGRRGMSFGA